MKKLSRMQRNLWVWTVPLVLGMVVCGALVCGQSLLVAQEQELGSFAGPPGGGGMMGGGESGGMGSVGMGGMSPVIKWVKPQVGKPVWLARGENSLRAREKMRRRLDEEREFQFNNQPLSSVVTFISDTYLFPVHIDAKGLEEENVTPEDPITFSTNMGSLRIVLQRILYPLNLDFIVHEDRLEITSRTQADLNGAVLAYNLAHVASNSSEGVNIVNTIKKMVRPVAWDDQGGGASGQMIGSVLLVKASEGMHEEIERLLALLNDKQPKDNTPTPETHSVNDEENPM
ncbi:MAG: hypothetical protein ACK553_17485 [Planctomycetota bacterium]|jgi:hypothetical protein